MTRPTTAPRNLTAAEREVQALELRKTGMTYRGIAKEMRVSLDTAHKAVRRALNRIRAHANEDAAEVREIELERLDAMLKGLWQKCEAGDTQAIDRALRISERRAKLLGLDFALRRDTEESVGDDVPYIVEHAPNPGDLPPEPGDTE